MRHAITAAYVLVGLINFAPLLGVLGAEWLESLYGLSIEQPDLLLLMRHRAVLFGLLGAFLIASAFRDEWRGLATLAGLVSMLAYLLLALPLDAHGAPLRRVFWIDIFACVLLVIAYWRHRS